MIEIIAGTFGYYNGRKVIPITNADGPQKFDPELEARLVKEGTAKYVEAQQADEAAPPATDLQPEDNGGDPAAGELPEYSEDMKLDELKEVAKAYGVDASSMRKKAEVIDAIEAAKAEEQASDGEDEEPPQLGVADPV